MSGYGFGTRSRRFQGQGRPRRLAFTPGSLRLAVIATVAGLGCAGTAHPAEALLIRVHEDQQLSVSPTPFPPSGEMLRGPGLLVWSENGRDRWQLLPADRIDALPAHAPSFVTLAEGITRGGAGPSPAAAMPPTTQLVQLIGQVVLKGSGFLTPSEKAVLLDGRITIERLPETGSAEPFPEDELHILQGDRKVLRLKIDSGEQTIRWGTLEGLPDALEQGLPPGEYTLRAGSGGASSTFRVLSPAERRRIMRIADAIRDLALDGRETTSLSLLVAVETMLGHRDERGTPQPLVDNAYELLCVFRDEQQLPDYLRRVAMDVRSRLEGEKVKPPVDPEATGIEAIDAARAAIRLSKWDEAARGLHPLLSAADRRTMGLAQLYQAVVLAESGPATGDVARHMFLSALERLRGGDPADRLRAHNNLGTFLLNRAQDRVYNHAFQMASGVESPLFAALVDWYVARRHLEEALAAAGESKSQVSGVEINLARAYCTLADMVRVVDASGDDHPATREILKAAESWAERTAVRASQSAESTGDLGPAVGREILAHLAFRRGDREACLAHAERALADYLRAGSLAGCESIYRLRGLVRCPLDSRGDTEGAARLALADLQTSQLLAELLRERVPMDQAGLSRAGFLARRAYVNERIVELLVGRGRDAEALKYSELAKARALQDVLAAARIPAALSADATETDPLNGWPSEVAAIEYFVGTERVFLFVVSPDAHVTTFQLKDEQGKPLASRELIARVHRLITGLDKLGPVEGRRIAQQASAKRGLNFERSWQQELHALYNILVPAECRDAWRSARTLVVVPHHILHYFPFAALVTELDATTTNSARMPLPRFFVEEPFSLAHAPSLTTWRLLRAREPRPLDQVNVVGIVDFGGRAGRLNGVATEINNLHTVFGPRIRRVLAGDEATETAARELLSQRGVLSISTHGQKVPDRPLEAYLICQADSANDGYLRAAEIYSLPVHSDLILLNACYGGFADRSPLPGDDLFGIQRALLHSGARTVVAGLWDVYDATAPDIMHDFWRHIAAGTPAVQSLAEAQRAHLKTWRAHPQEPLRFLTHPYYWAVFTVTGDDRTGSGVRGGSRQPSPARESNTPLGEAVQRNHRVTPLPPARHEQPVDSRHRTDREQVPAPVRPKENDIQRRPDAETREPARNQERGAVHR